MTKRKRKTLIEKLIDDGDAEYKITTDDRWSFTDEQGIHWSCGSGLKIEFDLESSINNRKRRLEVQRFFDKIFPYAVSIAAIAGIIFGIVRLYIYFHE